MPVDVVNQSAADAAKEVIARIMHAAENADKAIQEHERALEYDRLRTERIIQIVRQVTDADLYDVHAPFVYEMALSHALRELG